MQLVQQFDPGVLYLSSQVSNELLEQLSSLQPQVGTSQDGTLASVASVYQWPAVSENGQNSAAAADSERIHLKSSRYFKFAQALNHLLGSISNMPQSHKTAREQLDWIQATIGTDCQQAICAGGALMAILAKEKGHPTDSGNIVVRELRHLSVPRTVAISKHTLTSLRILDRDRHPSLMGIGVGKEGFSVLTLLDRCVTAKMQGKRLLRQWIEAPTWDLEELERRQESIHTFVHDMESRDGLRKILSQVGDPLLILKKVLCSQAVPRISELRTLLKSCNALFQLAEALSQNALRDTMDNVISLLCAWFDFEEHGQGILLPGNEELDSIKAEYTELPNLLRKVADQEVARVPAWLASLHCPSLCLSCHFCTSTGYLMFSHGAEIPEALIENIFADYKFWSHEADFDGHEGVFYKCGMTDMLNRDVGNIQQKIDTIEEEVQNAMALNSRWLAELDVVISLGTVCAEHHFVRPVLTNDNRLRIVKGWHPLGAALVSRFHPNDTVMHTDSQRVMIVTGPNCSGKSVYLQQVGIIVFMAHIGCFVPAAWNFPGAMHALDALSSNHEMDLIDHWTLWCAEIGLVDRIIARTDQDGEAMESYATDVVHMSNMCRLTTEKSLVLIDELGKGTLPVDGAALLISALSQFSLQPVPPRIVCVTHCLEVVDEQWLPRCVTPDCH